MRPGCSLASLVGIDRDSRTCVYDPPADNYFNRPVFLSYGSHISHFICAGMIRQLYCLSPMDTQPFLTDWFSRHIPLWEKRLAEFRGQPAVHFLEIGSWEGRSAGWLLTNILTHDT